eukprot:Nitzschia sp. Nitz4//scaffold38_size140716//127600//128075//NITZ4_003174-RA/size140716-snap-gene-0.150-mRNA-1//1//CDS//3329550159//1568//frame0
METVKVDTHFDVYFDLSFFMCCTGISKTRRNWALLLGLDLGLWIQALSANHCMTLLFAITDNGVAQKC